MNLLQWRPHAKKEEMETCSKGSKADADKRNTKIRLNGEHETRPSFNCELKVRKRRRRKMFRKEIDALN